jgi:hypothetical protein
MVYSNFTNSKFRVLVKAIAFLLIISLSSCMTVENRNYTPDEFRLEEFNEDLEIKNISTNTDTVFYKTNNDDIAYCRNYKDIGDIFLMSRIDSIIKNSEASNSFEMKKTNRVFKMGDIRNIGTSKSKINVLPTLVVGLVITAVLAAFVMTLALREMFSGMEKTITKMVK